MIDSGYARWFETFLGYVDHVMPLSCAFIRISEIISAVYDKADNKGSMQFSMFPYMKKLFAYVKASEWEGIECATGTQTGYAVPLPNVLSIPISATNNPPLLRSKHSSSSNMLSRFKLKSSSRTASLSTLFFKINDLSCSWERITPSNVRTSFVLVFMYT